MYKLSIPFMLSQVERYGAGPFISKLKEAGADVAFLALDAYETDEKKRNKVFELLKETVPVFRKEGFDVGVWVWAFMVRGDRKYTHITSPNGAVSENQVCPSDADFCEFAMEYLRSIAASKPDLIMFDDDYRYGFLDCGLGCACKNHRAYMSGLIGEELPEKDLGKYIFGGGRNKYRSAFLKANGYFLTEFAKKARAAVDTVDTGIRLSLCSCMTSWDFDGVSAAELARIMAGKTKPFLRLIGAPYWTVSHQWGNRLQDVIELERMEASWCGDGIELLSEGDVYPRPRFCCPSNYLEGFDMALLASGALSGIHKYTFDYYSDPDYEPGYHLKHIKNREIRGQIDRLFAGKTPVGVRVYEKMTKFEDMDVPAYYEGSDGVEATFFSPAARMLASQTVPTVYEGLGTVGAAFGENAKYLEEGALDNGLILDVTAARILEKRGVDVGLASVNGVVGAAEELIPESGRCVNLYGCSAPDITVKAGAAVQSWFVTDGEKRVGSYTYENADGQKFLVFAFDGYGMSEHACRQQVRGSIIRKAVEWMGKRLPADLSGNPDCYMLCRENWDGKAVWIGNFFADECLNTTVVLDREYESVEFINCTGKLSGDRVVIDGIAPYASVGFCVK